MINIVREPKGRTYRALLRLALVRASHFALVWRTQLAFDGHSSAFATALQPFLADESVTSNWPGTELIGSTALVRRYVLDERSVRHLEHPGRLYAWRSPSLPEDLAFYTSTGQCWLASISHERDAWLYEAPDVLPALLQAVPGLAVQVGA